MERNQKLECFMTTHFSAPIIGRPWQDSWLRSPDYQRASAPISRRRAAIFHALRLCPEVPTQIALASSRLGRVTLHAFCLLRRPRHARWHWHGIQREFQRRLL